MGKRYYCDYCDKSFADNPTNRRLHLSGGIHLRNKRAHYDAIRDERDILQEDLHKKPCRTFLSTGDCRFGDRCQFSHLTEVEKTKLSQTLLRREQVKEERQKNEQEKLDKLADSLPEWVAKRSKRLQTAQEEESEGSSNQQQMNIPTYEIADCLQGFATLPPSLKPPSRDDILSSHYPEWG